MQNHKHLTAFTITLFNFLEDIKTILNLLRMCLCLCLNVNVFIDLQSGIFLW